MKLDHLYWRTQSKFYKICGELFHWLPENRKKIVFDNFFGHGFGDSPKYIAEEIIRRDLKYDLVWIVSDLNMEVPPQVRKVKLLSIRTTYELSTAKIIVSNVKVNLPYHKKSSQYYIQTWHGSMAFKSIEKAAQDKLRPEYVRESMADSKHIDLFLSCNSIQTQEIRDCFWYDGEIFECGSPRNDMLYQSVQYKDKIKQHLGISPETKIMLYAPTFRDDFRMDVYNLDLARLHSCLCNKMGGDWRVLVRIHPNVMEKNIVKVDSHSMDVTSYPDMQELLLISDVLITDYSTTIYDTIIMHKILFLYAPDIVDYKKNRGLNPIYFRLPTQVCQMNEDLLDYIYRFDRVAYQQRLDDFLCSVRIFDDGNASKRVVDKINTVTKLYDV